MPLTALSPSEIDTQLKQLGAEWSLHDGTQLKKSYSFPDFLSALDFVNKLAPVAEEQQHHPDLFLAWGKVEITLWTHSLNGLSSADFQMAAACDQVHGGLV